MLRARKASCVKTNARQLDHDKTPLLDMSTRRILAAKLITSRTNKIEFVGQELARPLLVVLLTCCSKRRARSEACTGIILYELKTRIA